ncbi:MAG: hypothetical protein AAF849_23795 [Bacteroidota bacterium]
MSNTITLSTDMKTLYLIDDERAIPFDLTGKGAIIGTLGGQVTVISSTASKTLASKVTGKEDRKEFPIKNSQWTVNFNEEFGVMHVIGAVDVDSFISRPIDGGKCSKVGYDLERQIVSIRRKGDALEVRSMVKKMVVEDKES